MFSVIIPIYNSSATILEPIASLNSQTLQDFEVLFCDDCSADFVEVAEIIKKSAKFRFKVLQLPRHVNQVAARNLAMAHAQGDYFCFLDSDDSWDIRKLELLSDRISKSRRPYSTLFFHPLVCRKEDGGTFVHPLRGKRPEESVSSYLFFGNGMMQSSSLAFHRSAAARIGFDESSTTHEDWDLALDAERAGLDFEYIDEPLGNWNVRRMIGKSQRDKAAVSLNWYEKGARRFDAQGSAGFLINIIFPKLLAEKEVVAAGSLFLRSLVASPVLTAASFGRLWARVRAKTKRK